MTIYFFSISNQDYTTPRLYDKGCSKNVLEYLEGIVKSRARPQYQNCDPHSLANIVKAYFSALPEAFLSCLANTGNSSDAALQCNFEHFVNSIFPEQPFHVRHLTLVLLKHLNRLEHYKYDNRMSVQKLASIFGLFHISTILLTLNSSIAHKKQ